MKAERPHITEIITRAGLSRWECSCGESSGGRGYRSPEEAQKKADRHREKEPSTMARVQGMIEERWPGRGYTVWISPQSPRRHIAVRIGREGVEGAADTWLEAMAEIEKLIRPKKGA